MNKLQHITVLRALAILGVITIHVRLQSAYYDKLPSLLQCFINNGPMGVQLFYMLSAFTLFRSFNRRANEANRIKNYTIRRFFRIAPLFYLGIFYYLWQNGLGPRPDQNFSVTPLNIVSNFFFLHGVSPYWINNVVFGGWSVTVEAMFYCLLPFLYKKIGSLQYAVNFLMITLLLRFVLLTLFTRSVPIADAGLWKDYLYYYLPNQLPVFAIGIILYFITLNEGDKRIKPVTYVMLGLILLAGTAINHEPPVPVIMQFAIAFMLLAITLQKHHPKILFNRVMFYIGEISYTLYLTHPAVIYWLWRFKKLNIISGKNTLHAVVNFGINYVFTLIISISIATVLFYTIERPMQKLGGKLIKNTSR